jgi:YesN/AraC family two-component response regulator
LDSELSLKKFSVMIDTNQTYLSNVVNKYFNCNLKELLNTYRVEYAKELLHAGKCSLEELPQRCGFASRSAFYASFSKIVGMSPLRFLAREQNNSLLESMIYV